MAPKNKRYIAFGKQLTIARLQMGINAGRAISQGEMAKKIGIGQSFLSQMEKGNKHPSVTMLTKILNGCPKECGPDLLAALGIDVQFSSQASSEEK